jgi:hypothetical protein
MLCIQPYPFVFGRIRQVVPVIIEQITFVINIVSDVVDHYLLATIFCRTGMRVIIGFGDLVLLDVFQDARLR